MADQSTPTPSQLEMSDEDFLKQSAPPVITETPADHLANANAEVDTDPAANAADPAAKKPDVEEDDEPKDPVDPAADPAATPAAKDPKDLATEPVDPAVPKDPADKPKDEPKDPAEKPADVVIDYKAEYERLLKPFKANGREVAVASIDDAISLMQMGANYNKKMAGLKPSLKILKLLENNSLLDESKLSFLIDLDKKDPKAINKLVKDSGINPMDLTAEKAGEYEPKTHSVDERELDLDAVLDEIQSTPTYNQTLALVSKKWDGPSKQAVAAQPQLLKVINDHMASGVYELISKEMESERMFGRLDGLSDIEAYRKVGDSIQARGGFNHLGTPQGKSAAAAPEVVTPKPKVDDSALKDKRRAASATPAAAAAAPSKDFNPLSLSDEEFSKLSAPALV